MSLLIDESVISSAVTVAEELSSLGDPCEPVRLGETAGSSLLFLARPGAKQSAYCLKVRKPVRSIPPTKRRADQLSTALEYEMIVRVCEHFARFPELSRAQARPVRLLADYDAILMEHAGGRQLKELLPRWGNVIASAWNIKKLRRVAETCGAWVNVLHRMDPPEWLPVRPWDGVQAHQRALRVAAGLPEPLRRHLPIHDLLGQIRAYRQRDQRLVVSHGDFQPGNILVTGSGITVVDLGLAAIRPMDDDLAFFVALMFTQKYRVVFGDLVASRALVRELCDAFLASYGFRGEDSWNRLRSQLAAHSLERLAQMSDTIERLPRAVQPFLIRRLAAWARSELMWMVEWR